ncbi:MAG: methylated-DNA--[protein]-cysteine S-methyltransferase [Armatimonadota bacterium]
MNATSIVIRTREGWLAAAAQGKRILGVTLGAPSCSAALASLAATLNTRNSKLETGNSELLRRLSSDLERYFAGEPVDFTSYELDLDHMPPFLHRALVAARRIPRGQVRSYGWLAKAAGNAKAARAAGQAMARNPIPIIIPCHRVIASNGGLGGFGGGLELKRRLLEMEGARVG